MSVYGTYTPSETNLCFAIRMMNGSTINLGNRTTAMPVFLSYDSANPRTMTFESGATVSLDFGSRKLANGEKVISWSAIPAGVKFAEASRKWGLFLESDGIYVQRGLVLVFK